VTHAPNSPEARDVAHHLHPYTDAVRHEEVGPLVIDHGDGVRVFDIHGKSYIEAMAGLWSVALGFSEKRLVEAATRQMSKLPFYHTFGHKAQGPSIDLAERLIGLAPVPMSKVHFTNSGSEANDTVMKLLRYRSNALGEPKRKTFIARNRAYHGVTLASASLTGLPANHRSFDLPIDGVKHTLCPHFWREGLPGESEEAFAGRCADELEKLILAEGPETVAAFWAEPVMGAGGVIVPPKTYWEKIQRVLTKYGVLLVADEVICGFGRTGNWFGSTTLGLRPNVIVCSKQLSSSYLPISAVLIDDEVYRPIAEESHRIGTFGHGLTASGHPVAAAVALENLAIIEERDLIGNVRRVGAHLGARLRALADHPLVGEVRGIGLIWAVELVVDRAAKTALEPVGRLGGTVAQIMQENGVISRAMGDALAFCPPMIVTESEIDEIVDVFVAALDEARRRLGL
jgi:4-aminobutyrate--pyruvate transaminase